eukprot:g2621.t1
MTNPAEDHTLLCEPFLFFFRLRNYIKSIDVKMKAETDELMDFHLHGPSGAMSSILPAVDALLGIRNTSVELREAVKKFEDYVPKEHRCFLEKLRNARHSVRLIGATCRSYGFTQQTFLFDQDYLQQHITDSQMARIPLGVAEALLMKTPEVVKMLHVPQVPVMSLEGSLLWDPTGSNGFVTARRARLPGWGPFMEAPHEGGKALLQLVSRNRLRLPEWLAEVVRHLEVLVGRPWSGAPEYHELVLNNWQSLEELPVDFILSRETIHLVQPAEGGRAICTAQAALAPAITQRDTGAVIAALNQLAADVESLSDFQMRQFDPRRRWPVAGDQKDSRGEAVMMQRLRPFVAEGLSDEDYAVWVYTEGSSPLLPALHALLGLRQLEPGMGCQTGTGWFLQRLWGGEGDGISGPLQEHWQQGRPRMPQNHRNFLDRLEQGVSIRAYCLCAWRHASVEGIAALEDAFNNCIEALLKYCSLRQRLVSRLFPNVSRIRRMSAEQEQVIRRGRLALLQMRRDPSFEELSSVFAPFDPEGTGQIPKEVFLHLMTSVGDRFEAEEVDSMMVDLQSGKEDMVSYKEFITWALERLRVAASEPRKGSGRPGLAITSRTGFVSWEQPPLPMGSSRILRCGLILLASAQSCEHECTEGAEMALVQKRLSLQATEVKPWDRRVYLVGTSHKAGSQLLRNIMNWAFDTLGANMSCQKGGRGVPITSPHIHVDCDEHPLNIRFDNTVSGKDIVKLRNETRETGGFRGVMIIRDPFEMLISAYCYHHRGAEPDSILAPDNITKMPPAEGVPAMAPGMLGVIKMMEAATEVARPDVIVIRYEAITASSEMFNPREALELLPEDVYAEFQHLRAQLGYY